MIGHKTHAESLLDEIDSLRRSELVENEDHHITKNHTSGLNSARRSQNSNKEVHRKMESILLQIANYLLQIANFTVNVT